MAQALATTMPDNPLVRQVSLMVGIAASVALGVAVVLWSQSPNYTPLYGSLAENDAAQVVQALQQAGVEYKVDDGTGLVLVPTGKLREIRMSLATQNLPNGGGLGFEVLQQETGFGTSRLVESARYHHALEGELARTIATLSNINTARVHLALPKQSVFVRKKKKPSASVTLKLFPGRPLEKGQVEAIVHLVASSIPDLESTNVTVVDQKGNLLSMNQASPEMHLSSSQYEYTRTLENNLRERIENLLSPILGGERVRAEVSADIDFTISEQTQERFNPDQPALRSEQLNEAGSSAGPVQGVPGALSNQPPAAGAAPQIAAGAPGAEGEIAGNSSRQSTRNYELDRVISHTRNSLASLRRLSVAVIVDDIAEVADDKTVSYRERTPEELESIAQLVREAVGYSPQRGDRVKVINSRFIQPEPIEALPEPSILEQAWVWDAAKQAGGFILVVLLIFMVLRPTLKKLTETPSTEMVPAGATASGTSEGEAPASAGKSDAGEGLLVGADGEPIRLPGPGGYENVMEAARELVNEDPKRVAQVVKTWMSKDNG